MQCKSQSGPDQFGILNNKMKVPHAETHNQITPDQRNEGKGGWFYVVYDQWSVSEWQEPKKQQPYDLSPQHHASALSIYYVNIHKLHNIYKK